MKKFLKALAIAGFMGLVAAGCGSSDSVSVGGTDLPNWVVNPPHVLSAVGSAKKGNSLPNAMNIATERARAELAKNVGQRVETKFKDLTNTDAEGKVDGGTTAAIRNYADLMVKGSSRTNFFNDEKNGDVYVLVEITKENLKLVEEYMKTTNNKIDTETSRLISKAVDELIDGK